MLYGDAFKRSVKSGAIYFRLIMQTTCRSTTIHDQQPSTSIDNIDSWTSADRLKLNMSKTKVLLCSLSVVSIRSRFGQLVSATLNLGFLSPWSLAGSVSDHQGEQSMETVVTATVRSRFAALRHVRCDLPRRALITLIHALMISKVDYCNSLLAGVSGHLLDRLQSVSTPPPTLCSEL